MKTQYPDTLNRPVKLCIYKSGHVEIKQPRDLKQSKATVVFFSTHTEEQAKSLMVRLCKMDYQDRYFIPIGWVGSALPIKGDSQNPELSEDDVPRISNFFEEQYQHMLERQASKA